MMTHEQRAAKMYGGPPAAKAPAKPAAAKSAESMYPKSKPGQAGSNDAALASTFDRLEAWNRSNPEKLARVREQRAQLVPLLHAGSIDPRIVQELLSIHLEHETFKRSPEALAKRWEGPTGYAKVRSDAGDAVKAEQKIAATDRVLAVLAKAAPTFAHDVVMNGAAQHPRWIEIASAIAPSPVSTTATEK